jgi:hypothetical protein
MRTFVRVLKLRLLYLGRKIIDFEIVERKESNPSIVLIFR